MKIEYTDFNSASDVLSTQLKKEWRQIQLVLQQMPLHLKESDQAGIQGRPIFDVVGTNEYIKKELMKKGWASSIPLPNEFRFMGTNIDYGRNGMVVEAQFSNYPFLLNNILRAELFYKSGLVLAGKKTLCATIITKGHMFPASNSTLYYEQGVNQLNALSKFNVFDVPIRLVGLKCDVGDSIAAVKTVYSARRYSRTVVSRKAVKCSIRKTTGGRGRCLIEVK